MQIKWSYQYFDYEGHNPWHTHYNILYIVWNCQVLLISKTGLTLSFVLQFDPLKFMVGKRK